jgi:hypothetical protein
MFSFFLVVVVDRISIRATTAGVNVVECTVPRLDRMVIIV